MTGPAVCPNGHAMDEGYFNCPACGAYRPSANAPKPPYMSVQCGSGYHFLCAHRVACECHCHDSGPQS